MPALVIDSFPEALHARLRQIAATLLRGQRRANIVPRLMPRTAHFRVDPKLAHVPGESRTFNGRLGYETPVLITPLELLNQKS